MKRGGTGRGKAKGGTRGGPRGGRGRRLRVSMVWFNALLLGAVLGWFFLQPPARQEEVKALLGNYAQREKRITLLEVVRDLYDLYYAPGVVAVEVAGDKRHTYGGFPRADALGVPVRVLQNQGYVVGYADALRSPVWAAYRMVDLPQVPAAPPRPDVFEVDRRTVARVRSDEYTNSGYDRGHLAPNHAIATRYGAEAQRETFLMSNIVPQRRALNAGEWRALEQKIATSYPGRYGEVWVVVGPVFDRPPARLPSGVARPEAFFMVVVDETDRGLRTQAVILPQELPAGARRADFRVSIDEVERRTGLDFFVELADEAEAALEALVTPRVW